MAMPGKRGRAWRLTLDHPVSGLASLAAESRDAGATREAWARKAGPPWRLEARRPCQSQMERAEVRIELRFPIAQIQENLPFFLGGAGGGAEGGAAGGVGEKPGRALSPAHRPRGSPGRSRQWAGGPRLEPSSVAVGGRHAPALPPSWTHSAACDVVMAPAHHGPHKKVGDCM